MGRYTVGDYTQWWTLNRDEFLLQLKPAPDMPEYLGAPPDTVPALLTLIGYEGHFASFVKELGLRRLSRTPKVNQTLVSILKDPKALPPQRSWAAYALGDLKARAAIPDLKNALKETDVDLKGFAALALGKMEAEDAYEAILPFAVDPRENEDLRCLVILTLAPSELPKVREALAEIAVNKSKKDMSLSARRAALMALGVKASESEATLLTDFCEDKDPYLRSAAMVGLGLTGKGDEILRRHLNLRKETDILVRAYAALSLGISANPANAKDLIDLLNHEMDFTVRSCAALALGRVHAPDGVEALDKVLNDRNGGAASDYAAVALGLTRKPEALSPLVKQLDAKLDSIITSCIVGLSILGDAKAEAPLVKSLENKHYADVREFAAVGLGLLRQEDVFPKLLEGLKDRAAGFRHACAIALAVYGDPKACPALEKCLDDKDPLVRGGAALAFDLLTDDDKRPLTLGEELKGDPRNEVRRRVGLSEITRLLNRYLPKEYKLPITP